MTQVTKYAIATKVSEDDVAVRTVVEVDFEGFTIEDAKNMFFKSTSPRVAVQSALRHVKGGIPASWKCNARDFAKFGNGAGERVMTPQEMIDALVVGAKDDPAKLAQLKQALGL